MHASLIIMKYSGKKAVQVRQNFGRRCQQILTLLKQIKLHRKLYSRSKMLHRKMEVHKWNKRRRKNGVGLEEGVEKIKVEQMLNPNSLMIPNTQSFHFPGLVMVQPQLSPTVRQIILPGVSITQQLVHGASSGGSLMLVNQHRLLR